MRTLSAALILFALLAIANITTAHAGTPVDSYFYIDNDFEATIHVEITLERLSNGNYVMVYRITVYPVNFPPTFTTFTRADPMTRPIRPQEEEEITRRCCDPNCNGVPRWLDPNDRIQIDYQLQ